MKTIEDYKINDYIAWQSYEGIKERGSGQVVDVWNNKEGRRYITAQNRFQIVCLSKENL